MKRSNQTRHLAILLTVSLIAYSGYGFACSVSDVSRVKKKVADAAAILNTAAKSNRSLYQSGLYGATGSPEAIAKRQKVATAIHQANEYLSLAVERAANLQPSDLEVGKANIVSLLQQATSVLAALNIDNENIRAVITSAVTAINAAVTLTLAIKGGK
ncbi:MAG TPA: hypothetical protein VL866_24570 [Pyrinomonadaceae bacterium]|jgi:hypothetical protein|nr:hypothetical protein [Pyrinomonadaceae bacterium]